MAMLATAACFKASPPTGVPCETDTDCPSSQVCHTVSRTCEATCDGCDVNDGAVDQPIDAPRACWDKWAAHSVTFDPPRKLDELQNVLAGNANPSVTFDELAIYFERNDNPFRATRQSTSEPFGPPSQVSELQTAQRDSRISTTTDDRVAVFASSRNGTVGLLDLWQARRQGNQPFGTPSSILFAALNTTSNEFDPEITPDGLDLYWSPNTGGPQQIHHASRGSIDAPFGNAETLTLSATNQVAFFDPGISPDQLVIAFAADDGTVGALGNLFYATRASAADPFGTAVELAELNSMAHDGDADLASDGCTLYFSSSRDGASAIYAASVQRQ